MKKQYVKPMIAVEQYVLSQTIASCATKIGFLSSDCVKNDIDATNQMKDLAWSGYFVDSNNCEISSVGMDVLDGICYHTNANAAFNS